MKKFISIALGMVLALSMVACSSNGGSASDTSKNSVSYEGTYEELLEMAETVELNNDTFEQYFEIVTFTPKNEFGEEEDCVGYFLKSKLYDDGYVILNTDDELEDIAVGINDVGIDNCIFGEYISDLSSLLDYGGSNLFDTMGSDLTFAFSRVTDSQLKILPLDYVKSYERDEDIDGRHNIEFINGYKMTRYFDVDSKY